MRNVLLMDLTSLQSFHNACDAEDISAVDDFVTNSNLSIRDSYGLHIACRRGNMFLVEYLMFKVNINIISNGKYAIDEAAFGGFKDIVERLIMISNKSQVLKYAIKGNHISTIKFVLGHCHITDYSTLFKDIRSLEVFQLVLFAIVSLTDLDETDMDFLTNGIEYQFKKIRHSINKNRMERTSNGSSSTLSTPSPSSEKMISPIDFTGRFVSELSIHDAPPVPAISEARKKSLTSPNLQLVAKSILKSPSVVQTFPTVTTLEVVNSVDSPELPETPETPYVLI